MLLRLFLKVVKPINEQLRKSKDNSWLSKTTLNVYQWFLSILQKTYLYYAISDTIVLENGRIKIIHESRDIEFENELKRNGIDIHLHMLTTSMPFNAQKRKGLWYKYFRFSNLVSVYIDDKELFIKHDSSFSINGTMRAKLKTSSPSDILYGSVIEVIPLLSPKSYDQKTIVVPQQRHQQEPIQTSNDKGRKNAKTKQTSRVNIFGNDVLPTPKRASANKIEEDKTKEFIPIEKKGFKIDTSF